MTRSDGRVILFGATGYTGEIALAELGRYGLPLTLVGRDPRRLQALAESHGVAADVEFGDASRGSTLPRFNSRDVVISTVGPFTRVGFAVVDAAIEAGAVYLDSTGEPPFLGELFQSRSTAATRSGAVVVPAFGYDYTPGAVAAADAIARAPHATRVQIGYFLTDQHGAQIPLRRLTHATTPGTRASLAGVISEKSFTYRAIDTPFGLEAEPSGAHLLRFNDLQGRRLRALSIGGAEHFSIPEAFPHIEAVDVGLGWLAAATTPLHVATRLLGSTITSRPAQAITAAVAARLPWQSHKPTGSAQSTVIAKVTDSHGHVVARSVLRGTEPYQFTGRLLAWGANEILSGRRSSMAVGVTGPIKAFGIDRITTGVNRAGIARITNVLGDMN